MSTNVTVSNKNIKKPIKVDPVSEDVEMKLSEYNNFLNSYDSLKKKYESKLKS